MASSMLWNVFHISLSLKIQVEYILHIYTNWLWKIANKMPYRICSKICVVDNMQNIQDEIKGICLIAVTVHPVKFLMKRE